jgi:putative addiction module killer protein
VTRSGKDVVGEWLARLKDVQARARVATRIARLEAGNFGDCRPVGDGVWELRIDWGPGYRLYCAVVGAEAVLLLCGGDKRKQAADIRRATALLKDYRQRTTGT